MEISSIVTDCEKGYIEICCDVDGESILDIFSFQMKRFDGDDAFVVMEIARLNEQQEHVVLVDTELASRTGVVVNSSISTAGLSYLSIRIILRLDEIFLKRQIKELDCKKSLKDILYFWVHQAQRFIEYKSSFVRLLYVKQGVPLSSLLSISF